MTEICLDGGTMQAFLDGELAAETTEAAARHIAVCDACAILLATAEEESALTFSVLEPELNALVPTQRLWTKINDSIAREKPSFWKPIFAFLFKPSTAAFASLAFVTVVSLTLLSLKKDVPNGNGIARTNVVEKPVANQTVQKDEPLPVNEIQQAKPTERKVETVNYTPAKNEIRAAKIAFVQPETKRTLSIPSAEADAVNPAVPRENVLGEDSYVKTIATLTATVNNRKDEVLSPSARFAFERDLAMTDDAIKQMRKEVRSNPNNEAAKQVLRASYQNKIDLLNAVADKTELMASLK